MNCAGQLPHIQDKMTVMSAHMPADSFNSFQGSLSSHPKGIVCFALSASEACRRKRNAFSSISLTKTAQKTKLLNLQIAMVSLESTPLHTIIQCNQPVSQPCHHRLNVRMFSRSILAEKGRASPLTMMMWPTDFVATVYSIFQREAHPKIIVLLAVMKWADRLFEINRAVMDASIDMPRLMIDTLSTLLEHPIENLFSFSLCTQWIAISRKKNSNVGRCQPVQVRWKGEWW